MSTQLEPIISLYTEGARHYAKLTREASEQMLKLHEAAAQELLARGKEQLYPLWSKGDPLRAIADRSTFVQWVMQKAVEVSRDSLEIATQAQTGLAQLTLDQMAALNRRWLESFQGLGSLMLRPAPGKGAADAAESKSQRLVA